MTSAAATDTDSVLAEGWEMVIGLEVHAELQTDTKLFCSCANEFGAEPNVNTCPTCLGLPGSLPVLNGQAVEYAMRLGRKNYFYPDMPKDYQVSQYDKPTNTDGHLDLPSGLRIGIERAHIEEDTGKSTHIGGDGRISTATYTLVDYNRAGVPLVEIVSHPEMHRSDDARAYVAELRDILLATGVSDARMEEGSMRVDANVSVRPVGSDELRTRCEIKNINSLRSLGRAIDYEARRHVDLWTSGESPNQETRHWDENNGRTLPGRSKEDADDYRYFPEPDLVPLAPTDEDLAAIDASMPALPAGRRSELAERAGVTPAEAGLAVERDLDAFAIAAIDAGASGGPVLKHVDNNLPDGHGSMTAEAFASLVAMEAAGDLTSNQVKDVLAELVENGGTPEAIAAERGFEAVDTGELEAQLDQLIAANPDEWQRYLDGDKKVQGFFVGQIMKATQGQADGKAVNALMNQKAQS